MPKILMSACLLGHKVRYDGKDNLQSHQRLQTWIDAGEVVVICPEMSGGLSTPRPAAEIEYTKTGFQVLKHEAKVITCDGVDVTNQFMEGAQKTLSLAQRYSIRVAILKARSPSCGSEQIYDGKFSRALVQGVGVTAALLIQHGIQVFDEDHIDAALDAVET